MKSFTIISTMVLAAAVAATPITPAAPEHQHMAEQMRSEGLSEHDIAERLALPFPPDSKPLFSQPSSKLHSLLRSPRQVRRDPYASGDIAPGSMESPQMLPRAASPLSLTDRIAARIDAVLFGEDAEKRTYGYEGKESEMRRPVGMRHWESKHD